MSKPRGYHGWEFIDGESGFVVLKGALHNLSIDENGDNHEFSKGLVVGVMSALLANGMLWDDATKMVWQLLPTKCHRERFPESWLDDFKGKVYP